MSYAAIQANIDAYSAPAPSALRSIGSIMWSIVVIIAAILVIVLRTIGRTISALSALNARHGSYSGGYSGGYAAPSSYTYTPEPYEPWVAPQQSYTPTYRDHHGMTHYGEPPSYVQPHYSTYAHQQPSYTPQPTYVQQPQVSHWDNTPPQPSYTPAAQVNHYEPANNGPYGYTSHERGERLTQVQAHDYYWDEMNGDRW